MVVNTSTQTEMGFEHVKMSSLLQEKPLRERERVQFTISSFVSASSFGSLTVTVAGELDWPA